MVKRFNLKPRHQRKPLYDRPARPSRGPVGRPRVGRVDWYWVVGRCEKQNILTGPYSTSEDAYQFGYTNLEGDWQVVELPTRDLKRANQIVRNRNISDGQTVGDVLKRTKHKF